MYLICYGGLNMRILVSSGTGELYVYCNSDYLNLSLLNVR